MGETEEKAGNWKNNFDPKHPRLDNVHRKVYVVFGVGESK